MKLYESPAFRYPDEYLCLVSVMVYRTPPASTPAVRKVMQGNKSKDTAPEIRVRAALREAGFPGYRLHWRIDDEEGRYVCRPDVSYPGRRLAIFVHGCFWHRCPKCDLPLPKSNQDYWKEKFNKNYVRDTTKSAELQRLGWRVLVIWECELPDTRSDELARSLGL